MEKFIVDALRLARRPLPVAELVRLRFGDAPTSGEREAIAAAARHLETQGRVTSELGQALNARGARRQQRVLTLARAELVEPAAPVAADDEFARAGRTPDIVVIQDADGWALAEDCRATHAYQREQEWSSEGMRQQAAECDDACRALNCIHPANWGRPTKKAVHMSREALLRRPEVVEHLQTYPRPVVIAPDGEAFEVGEGATVSQVVDAVHAERG
jgi:hypothetical protein